MRILLPWLLFLCLSCSWTPHERTKAKRAPSGENYSEILKTFTKAKWEELPEVQKDSIKNLVENLSKFTLKASFLSDQEKLKVFNEAKDYASRALPPLLENFVLINEGLDSSDDLFQIPRTPQWTLNSEIDYLKSIVSNQPRVPLDPTLPLFFDIVQRLNPEILDNFQIHQEKLSPDHLESLKDEMRNLIEELSQKETSDEKAISLINRFESGYEKVFDQIKKGAKKMAQSPEIKFNQPFWEKLVKEFIGEYYERIPLESLKNITSDFLALRRQAQDDELMSILFNNAGPGLGKTLQQIGREQEMGPSMARLMARLESEGKPVPSHLAKEVILKDPSGHKFLKISDEPIGTGTVAQVHEATILLDGEEVRAAVRFLKPGIEERAIEDLDLLNEIFDRLKSDPDIKGSEIPDLNKVHNTLKEFLFADLDVIATKERYKKAEEVYKRIFKVNFEGAKGFIDFHVPKLYTTHQSRESKLIVSEFIEGGQKFSQIENPKFKKAVSRHTVRLWVEEALFRSGYTHADLHEGNFKVFLYEKDNTIKVVFFDFGMNLNVSKETKRAFILIGAGAAYNEPRLIAKALLSFDPKSSWSLKNLTSVIQREIEKNGARDQASWVTWAIKNGHVIPDDLGVLVRGGSLLNQMPVIVGEKGIEVGYVEKFATTYFLGRVFNREFDYPLSFSDLTQLGFSMTKKKCKDLLSGFLKRRPHGKR